MFLMMVGGVRCFLVDLWTWGFTEHKDVGLMWVCIMFDPFFARESVLSVPSLSQCPGIHLSVTCLLLNFSFECSFRHSIISTGV